jgi:hypothetical protein
MMIVLSFPYHPLVFLFLHIPLKSLSFQNFNIKFL